jgi:hypothetical protein
MAVTCISIGFTSLLPPFVARVNGLTDIAPDAPETVILAEGEAILYLQPATMAVWAPQGQTPVVRAHPGHEKVNF